MRDYGKVYSAFWSSEEIRGMTEDARMLALYLMTGPHGNMLGCFRLPNAYAADDLQWTLDRVSIGFMELSRYGFATRCERSFWVVIHKHLKWNRLDNENMGKAAAKLFDSLAAPESMKALLAFAICEFGRNFPMPRLAQIEKKFEPYRNDFETVSNPVAVTVAVAGSLVTPTIPAGIVVAAEADDKNSNRSARPGCPHQEIIALYHEVLPQCPQVRAWTPTRAKQLRARWNEDEKRQNLAYWRSFFEYVSKCNFLVGRSGKTPFFADLDWMTKAANFTKIREQKYENRGHDA